MSIKSAVARIFEFIIATRPEFEDRAKEFQDKLVQSLENDEYRSTQIRELAEDGTLEEEMRNLSIPAGIRHEVLKIISSIAFTQVLDSITCAPPVSLLGPVPTIVDFKDNWNRELSDLFTKATNHLAVVKPLFDLAASNIHENTHVLVSVLHAVMDVDVKVFRKYGLNLRYNDFTTLTITPLLAAFNSALNAKMPLPNVLMLGSNLIDNPALSAEPFLTLLQDDAVEIFELYNNLNMKPAIRELFVKHPKLLVKLIFIPYRFVVGKKSLEYLESVFPNATDDMYSAITKLHENYFTLYDFVA